MSSNNLAYRRELITIILSQYSNLGLYSPEVLASMSNDNLLQIINQHSEDMARKEGGHIIYIH